MTTDRRRRTGTSARAATLALIASFGCTPDTDPPADRENDTGAATSQTKEPAKAGDPVHPGYTEIEATVDGSGKVYMGREIALVMGHEAIGWLERPEREREEGTNLVVSNMDLRPTDVVADIGAGSGYYSFRLARVVTEGRVLAVDIQQEMLDFIADRAKLDGVGNVVGVLGAIDDAKLPEGGVDVAFLVDAYHEFSHPWEMMRSIVRGLKPGGRVIMLEFRGEDPEVPIKPLHKMSESQVKAEMAAAGLEWVETRDFLPWQHFLVFRKP